MRQIVVQSWTGLYGLGLEDHEVLWQAAIQGGPSSNVPLVLPDGQVFVTTQSDARMFQVEAPGKAHEVWVTRDIIAEGGSFMPVYHEGHVYGFGKEHLSCLDAASGQTKWKERIYPGSLLLVDGHLVILSQHAGLLRVVRATPEGYQERARLQVFDAGVPAAASPSFSGGHLFLRSADEMVAVAIGSKG